MFYCAAVSSSDIFGTAVSIVLYWSIAPKLFRQIFFLAQKQLFRKYPMMTQRRNKTHSTSLPMRSDLSRQQVMTQRRIGVTGTFLCIMIRFVLLAIKLFVIPSNVSRHGCMKQQRSETSDSCLCIAIRFALLAVSFLQYDMICPDSEFGQIGALKRLARLKLFRTS